MARVNYRGQVFPVPDTDTLLLDYYRGDGAEVVTAADEAARAEWVASSTVPEVLDAVGAQPEIAGDVLAAERARGESARKTLVDALAPVVESAPQPGPVADPAV